MPPPRKGWCQLKPESRARYLRAGIGRSEYEAGAVLQPGRTNRPKPVRDRSGLRRGRLHGRS